MSPTDKLLAETDAKIHWDYISKLLQSHDEKNDVICKIGFHYKSAFIHGFKHGMEFEAKKNDDEPETNPKPV